MVKERNEKRKNPSEAFEEEGSELLNRLLHFCNQHKIPLVCTLQLSDSEFIINKLLYTNKTDSRMYTASHILENGCPSWTTVYSKSAEEFKSANDDVVKLLKEILNELIEHDSQYGDYRSPAGLCRTSFAKLCETIRRRCKQAFFPTE